MAMATGQGAQINVTPMIDILLVLLIIFMVIGPASSGFDTGTPQPAPNASRRVQRDVELWTQANGQVRLDGNTFPVAKLQTKLNEILKVNTIGAVFVHGEKNLDFEDVAVVVDEVRGAGLKQIAVMTN